MAYAFTALILLAFLPELVEMVLFIDGEDGRFRTAG